MRHGGRVIVGFYLSHVGLVVIEVQALHLVLLRIVLVDRLFVEHGMCAPPIHLCDCFVGVEVDDDEIVPTDAPETDSIGRVCIGCPMIGGATNAVWREMKHVVVGEKIQRLDQMILWHRSEAIGFDEWQLERGAL